MFPTGHLGIVHRILLLQCAASVAALLEACIIAVIMALLPVATHGPCTEGLSAYVLSLVFAGSLKMRILLR